MSSRFGDFRVPRMCNLRRRFLLTSLAAIVVAGCGTASPEVGPPPGKQQVTLYIKGMGERLKLM
jgi:hypothetical protein